MNIVCSTSDKYHHILKIFCFLFNRYWGEQVTVVGYKKPNFELPPNFSFYSMGVQGDKYGFCGDLRKYFETQEEAFIWLMEDTFIRRPLREDEYKICKMISNYKDVGRVSLTNNSHKFYTDFYGRKFGVNIMETPPNSDYRLSLQPAIWKKEYLLKNLKDGWSPWQFENLDGTLLDTPDYEFHNVSLKKNKVPLLSNEGVRRFDLYKYNFDGIDDQTISEMNELNIIQWEK